MTIKPFVHAPTEQSTQGHTSAQGLHDPIQELLDNVTDAVESRRTVSTAAPSPQGLQLSSFGAGRDAPASPAAPPRVAEGVVLDATETAQASLTRIVDRIRTQFRLLADLEIRRALERALEAVPESIAQAPLPAPPSETPIVYPREWHHDLGTEAAGERDELTSSINPSLIDPNLVDPGLVDPKLVDPKLFEGTVRLLVLANDNIQQVVRFVDELCRRPQLRLLRMSGGPQHDGTEISIGLREPLRVVELLESMGHAATTDDDGTRAGAAAERSVVVRLATGA